MPSVLVVDDDPDIRDVIALKLELASFDVHAEADGEAGLAAARQELPDLVLLDWMMPRLTGIEVCRALREDEQTAGLPVILLTAKAQEVDVDRGFAAGADDYIVKPFRPRELVRRAEPRRLGHRCDRHRVIRIAIRRRGLPRLDFAREGRESE